MDTLKRFFKKDKFAQRANIELLSVSPGQARAKMTLHPHHLIGYGTVQCGAIFTLADFAFGAAIKTGGQVSLAVHTSIAFLKATRSGTLVAEATEVSRSRKLSVCTVRVTNAAGELVAMFQGTAYIKDEPFPPA